MQTVTKTHPVFSFSFGKAYAVQMRPYLLFVSGAAGLWGMAMGAAEATEFARLVVAFVPFFLGYGFGQALTDCFQTDTDKLSAPYRPLSKGTVSVLSVLAVSIAGLCLCAVVLFALHWVSFALSGLAVFGLATYSVVKKRFWAAGPFYNAWIVALLPVMGYFAVAGSSAHRFPSSAWPFVAVTFFGYANFVLIGYLKDIDADRATGYRTFPVVWGWRKTVLLGDAFALLTIVFFWMKGHNVFAMVAGAAGTAVIVVGQWAGHGAVQHNPQTALLPILSTVRSFVLFSLGIALHRRPEWWPFCSVFYLLFEVFLFKRPSRFQV